MIQDSRNGTNINGISLLKENWEAKYHDNPPIQPTGCMGRIVQTKRFNDGRFNIVLGGLAKFTIKEEFYNKPYRQAWVEPVWGSPGAAGTLPDSLREDLKQSLMTYATLRGWEKQVGSVIREPMDDNRLVQVFSSELDLTPHEKQFLLEAEDLIQQCRRLIDLIGFMKAEFRSRGKVNRPGEAGD